MIRRLLADAASLPVDGYLSPGQARVPYRKVLFDNFIIFAFLYTMILYKYVSAWLL